MPPTSKVRISGCPDRSISSVFAEVCIVAFLFVNLSGLMIDEKWGDRSLVNNFLIILSSPTFGAAFIIH
jgi:hypothetical protein